MRRLPWLAIVPVLLAVTPLACEQQTPVEPADGFTAAKQNPVNRPVLAYGAQQPDIDNSISPLALYPLDTNRGVYGPYKQNIAQTFTATSDAQLRFIDMPIACATGVTARIRIHANDPDGTLLFDRSYDPGRFYADGTFVSFQIYGGVALTTGSVYAIELSSNPTGTTAETTCSIIAGPAGDSYTGGSAYVNNPGFLPYWTLFTDAGSSADDIPFRTIVR